MCGQGRVRGRSPLLRLLPYKGLCPAPCRALSFLRPLRERVIRLTIPIARSARRGHRTAEDNPAVMTAQQWLSVQDIHGGCLFRPDGGVVAGVTLAPYSLALKSEHERTRIIHAFQAALNGLTVPWEFVSLYRPVDLDAYLAALDHRLATVTGPRHQVLRDYTRWVQQQIQTGDLVERRYYLLMTRTGPDAVADHRQTLRGLVDDLGRIRGFRATVMTDADWREVLFLVFHAERAAIEPIPDGQPRPVPVYAPQGVNAHAAP
jgi:hypothetical protein